MRVEAILRASRPRPEPGWVAVLERRLLCSSTVRRRAPRRRTLTSAGLGLALVVALAMLVVVLSLAGTGPMGNGADSDARDECRVVAETRLERVPVLSRDSSGAPTVIYRTRPVTRRVNRCSRSARPRGAGDAAPGR